MTLLQLLAGSRGDLRLVSKLLPKLQQYFGKVREKTSKKEHGNNVGPSQWKAGS